MANYILTDTDLTAVADAIRAKAYPYIEYETAGAIVGDLNGSTWAGISAVAQAGLGDEFWDIGDCKEIILNGKIKDFQLSNYRTYIYIINFNYPINKTIADNNIIFGGFKTANGKDIALCYKYENTSKAAADFSINELGGNFGGWAGCDFRYDILGTTSTQPGLYHQAKTNLSGTTGYNATNNTIYSPVSNTLMDMLAPEFRNILRLWPRYTNNTGGSDLNNDNITEIIDGGISLLTTYEIFGNMDNNDPNKDQFEQNHQKLMKYYYMGNSRIKYNHQYQTTSVVYWLATPTLSSSNGSFSYVYATDNNNIGGNWTYYSYGLAPIFKV